MEIKTLYYRKRYEFVLGKSYSTYQEVGELEKSWSKGMISGINTLSIS